MSPKLLTYLFLSTAIISTMDFCFAMEPEEEDRFPSPRLINEEQNSPEALELEQLKRQNKELERKLQELERENKEFERKLQEYKMFVNHLSEACRIENILEKIENLSKFTALIQNHIQLVSNLDYKSDYIRLWAVALRQKGIAFFNYSSLVSPDESGFPLAKSNLPSKFLESQNLLRESVSALRESYKICRQLPQTLEYQTETQATLEDFDRALLTLGLSYRIAAAFEKDSAKIIQFCSVAFKTIKERERHLPKEELRKFLKDGLAATSNIYGDIITSCAEHFKEEPSLKAYQTLIKNADLLKDILDLSTDHLLSCPLIEQCLIVPKQSIKANHGMQKRQQNVKSKQSKLSPKDLTIHPNIPNKLPPVLDPDAFLTLLWSTYSGIQKGASNMILNLKTTNETLKVTYQSKGNEHLKLAVDAYKKHVYKGEYQGNSHEENYVCAILDSLAGNDKPIKDFHDALRQERKKQQEEATAKKIRQQQENQAEEKRKFDEECQATQRQTIQEKLTKNQNSTNETFLSSPFVEQGFEPFNASENKQGEASLKPKKPRVKTHGNPDPSRAAQKSLSKSSMVQGNESPEKKYAIVALDYDDHHVYLSLIGEVYNRKISSLQVQRLLAALHCKITPGKGSHQKATAHNHQVSIIPPWDGDHIPDYYRLELMNYLLHSIGIDPESVKVKRT